MAAPSLTSLEMTAIGAVSGTIEVCIMQPTVAVKNAIQEGRPIPRAPAGLYRGLLVRLPTPALHISGCLWQHIKSGPAGHIRTLSTAAGPDHLQFVILHDGSIIAWGLGPTSM